MTVVFQFVGGSLDRQSVTGDTDRLVQDIEHAFGYYKQTNDGEIGQRFIVSHEGGSDAYESTKRAGSSRCLYIRAQYVPTTA
ncbi:MAG: hypothetical protein K8U03_08500 [Planctomycetia bacterium]|nr:hypothetical protein [Planctomycetia bacterium]